MAVIMYGIPNCDTIKKAKRWLDAQGIDYTFYDYKKQPVTTDLVESFFSQLDWAQVVNKRGTTYRQLDEATKQSLDANSAVNLLIDNPSMIKRPVLSIEGQLTLGFKPDQYAELFQR
jgi:Spx/MgsR family transcriptional regulator